MKKEKSVHEMMSCTRMKKSAASGRWLSCMAMPSPTLSTASVMRVGQSSPVPSSHTTSSELAMLSQLRGKDSQARGMT